MRFQFLIFSFTMRPHLLISEFCIDRAECLEMRRRTVVCQRFANRAMRLLQLTY